MSKKQIRSEIKPLLKDLDRAAVLRKSAAIAGALFQLPAWRASRTVLTYVGRADEVDTRPIIPEALARGKHVYAPRVDGDALVFHRIESLNDVSVPHPYGMLEPFPDLPRFSEDFSPSDRGLVLVPGLAFDSMGNRLGRGKGFYDRFLSRLEKKFGRERLYFLGLCFHLQLLPAVPHTDADVVMDAVLTESDTIL